MRVKSKFARDTLLSAALLLGLIVLAFWKPLFHREYTLLAGGDMCSQSYPWFSVASHWFKQGEFVLWDPYVFSGKANLGELQPGLFYPPNWLVYLLPGRQGGANTDGMQGLIILHFFLGAWFTFLLARSFDLSKRGSLLAGLAFALGGYTRQEVGYLNIFSGLVWMPLGLLLYRRALDQANRFGRLKFLFGSCVTISLSFLAGHHAAAVHTGLLLGFYTLFHMWRRGVVSSWKSWVRDPVALLLVPLGVAALTPIQWVPSLEWARAAVRWVGGDYPIRWGEDIPYAWLGSTGNLSPQDGLSLLFPHLSTSANLYIGPVLLFFCLAAVLYVDRPEVRFFGILSGVYFFASWGAASAVHGWINTFLPGVWFAREVFHFLVPLQLCIALLSASGFDAVAEAFGKVESAAVRRFVRRAVWATAYLALVVFGVMLAARVVGGLHYSHVYIRTGVLLTITAAALGGILFLLYSGRLRASTFGLLVLGLIVFDFSSRISEEVQPASNPRGSANPSVRAFWKRPPLVDDLLRLQENEVFRLDDPDQVLPPNFGDVWRIDSTMGHGATMLGKYLDFRGSDWAPTSNASSLLNVRYFLAQGEVPGLARVAGSGAGVYRNPRGVPRTFVPTRYRLFEDDASVLSWIGTPLFDPRDSLLMTRSEFLRIPAPVRAEMESEDEAFEVRVEGLLKASDRRIGAVGDKERGRQESVVAFPWGWSPEDEITLVVKAREPVEDAVLSVTYYPQEEAPSTLSFAVRTSGGDVPIQAVLPGVAAGGDPEKRRQVEIPFGSVGSGETRLTLKRSAECRARLDSLAIRRNGRNEVRPDPGTASILSSKPGRVRIEAELSRGGLLVLSELAYSGWSATVDGSDAPVITVDYLLRAVPVPAGKHEIVFRFLPSHFHLSALVTVVSLLGGLGLVLAGKRRNPPPP